MAAIDLRDFSDVVFIAYEYVFENGQCFYVTAALNEGDKILLNNFYDFDEFDTLMKYLKARCVDIMPLLLSDNFGAAQTAVSTKALLERTRKQTRLLEELVGDISALDIL